MSTFNRELLIQGQVFDVCETLLPEEDAGESNDALLFIRINSSLPSAAKVETFYHEVVHMMLGLGGYSELLDPKLEEALAQYLGNALTQFLSSNGSLPVIAKGTSEEGASE